MGASTVELAPAGDRACGGQTEGKRPAQNRRQLLAATQRCRLQVLTKSTSSWSRLPWALLSSPGRCWTAGSDAIGPERLRSCRRRRGEGRVGECGRVATSASGIQLLHGGRPPKVSLHPSGPLVCSAHKSPAVVHISRNSLSSATSCRLVHQADTFGRSQALPVQRSLPRQVPRTHWTRRLSARWRTTLLGTPGLPARSSTHGCCHLVAVAELTQRGWQRDGRCAVRCRDGANSHGTCGHKICLT